MKKIFLVLMLFLTFSIGCNVAPFASPVVTGVIMWYQGEAHKYYNEEARTLYRAVKTTLKDLSHPITKDEVTKSGYYIVAGDEDRFKIVIRQVKPHITEIKIRVNFLGDKPYAELIYNQIDLNTNSIEFDNRGKPTKNKLRRRAGQ